MNKFLPIIMSGILALPTLGFAASSVRTLGGAGTYNGVTSVGSGTATRAGSVRAVPAVKVSKTTTSATTSPSTSGSTGTVSGNAGTGTRMSIGKYLSGSGVVSNKVSTSTAGAMNLPDFEAKFYELQQQVTALESSDDVTEAELKKIWKSLDDAATELDTEYLTKAEIEDLNYIDETALKTALAEYTKSTEIESTYAKKGDIAGIIVESLGDYATKDELNGYLKSSDFESKFTDAFNKSSGVTVINDTIDEISGKIEDLNTKITDFSVYDGAFDPDKLDVE